MQRYSPVKWELVARHMGYIDAANAVMAFLVTCTSGCETYPLTPHRPMQYIVHTTPCLHSLRTRSASIDPIRKSLYVVRNLKANEYRTPLIVSLKNFVTGEGGGGTWTRLKTEHGISCKPVGSIVHDMWSTAGTCSYVGRVSSVHCLYIYSWE